jgi:UDP-glucuronate 4-epimerase
MPGPTVLVTGGAGFIGSHLCRRLTDDGHEVRAIDNFHSNYDRRLKDHNLSGLASTGFEFTEGDICTEDLSALMEGCACVVHLAARAGVRPSLEDPVGYATANITGTIRVLEAAVMQGVPKVVFASSSSVYGDDTPVPFSESHDDVRPISPYGWTKLAGEKLCRLYHDMNGIDVTALRFFTVYGPGQRPDMAIHRFIRAALRDEEIPLYGDGTTSRDYTYIDDIIRAVIAAMDLDTGYDVINLGNSSPIGLAGLLEVISEATGRELRTRTEPLPQGDMLRTHADLAKARRLLGYTPSILLAEGIANQVEWYRDMMSRKVL